MLSSLHVYLAHDGSRLLYYVHTDAIGSVRSITNQDQEEVARHDFLPFGEEWAGTSFSNISDNIRFAGLERDPETGLDYAMARYYRPQSGRFTQVDDPSFADPFTPQSTDLYVYVYNNPLKFVDRSGHEGDCIGQYNGSTSTCEPWDLGLPYFLSWVQSQSEPITPPDREPEPDAPSPLDRVGTCAAEQLGLADALAVGAVLAGQPIPGTKPFVLPCAVGD